MSDDKLGALSPAQFPLVLEEPRLLDHKFVPCESRVMRCGSDWPHAWCHHTLPNGRYCGRKPAEHSSRPVTPDAPNSPLRHAPVFHGPDVQPSDVRSLESLQLRTLAVMKAAMSEFDVGMRPKYGWVTLRELSERLGCSEASASARLRALRSRQWGEWTVERERVPGLAKGVRLFRYRLA